MDLSILVLSYNTKKLTLKALNSIVKSLNKSALAFEILVLDNASTDNSAEAIHKQFKNKVKLYQSKSNMGFSRGNNFLVKKATGQNLLFLNSDIEVIDNAITDLFGYFSHQSRIDFVGGKLLNSDFSPQPSCGPLYNPWVAFAALFLKGDYWGLTRYSPTKIRQVGWISGACILTARAIYEKLRGFDERIFMYMEEIDLFKRAQSAGLRVGFYPQARFIHHGFASSNGKSTPVVNVFRGYLYYYRKHYRYLANRYIRLLLKTKAMLGYTLGILTRSYYLKHTYAQALKLID